MSESDKDHVRTSTLGFSRHQCQLLRLDPALDRINQIEGRLLGTGRATFPIIQAELKGLRETILSELGKRKFAFFRPPLDAYFEREKLFGDEVYDKFEVARQDVRDAGNCLAAELYTAAVFHLMRVAEHGLRKLAKKLRVKLSHSGKPMPIELGDWGKVITGVRNKITEVGKLPSGPQRQIRLEAYSSAADHCEYMKTIWRNNVAHARKPYIEPEAIAVFGRVRDFMRFLGEYL